LIDAIVAAKTKGATQEQLKPALDLQRKAQWRLDFIAAENSMGFHAPQEAARVLGEAADYARQGQLAAIMLTPVGSADTPVTDTSSTSSASAVQKDAPAKSAAATASGGKTPGIVSKSHQTELGAQAAHETQHPTPAPSFLAPASPMPASH